jgi:uncharacterized protein YwgA
VQEKDLFGVLNLIGSFKVLNSRKRIQKMVCIGRFDTRIEYPFSFTFQRYLYGPYSFELKEFLDRLINLGLIKEELINRRYKYSLSKGGRIILSSLKKEFVSEARLIRNLTRMYPATTQLNTLVAHSKAVFGW